jgi:shikimate dehydrogenase
MKNMHIDGKTKIYGLIGYPVKHTLSPAMHNAAFKSLRINAAYMAFEVKPRELKAAISCARSIGICGLNVTIPHKENVLCHLDGVDKEASLIGAVNTIVVKGGRLKGFNTDGRGFVASLKKAFGISPKGRSFFIIGAGGASRAISFSLALGGARRIVLVDEMKNKAIRLASSLAKNTSCEAIALKRDKKVMKEMILNSDVLVNATPCGMEPSDPQVIDPSSLHKGLFVCDIIYNPRVTRLLREARKMGAKTLNGAGMLLNQGAISFELWTGRKAPLGVMKRAIGC